MMKIFCPFLNGECKAECIFNNGSFDEGNSDNCDLQDSIKSLQSLNYPDNIIDKKLKEIINKLDNISSLSYDIEEIKNYLEEIKSNKK